MGADLAKLHHSFSLIPEIEIRQGVGVIIFREDGRVLLGKRMGSHGSGTWAFPGGHCESGETFTQCAKRETLEEVGLTLQSVVECHISRDLFAEESVEYVTHFMIAKYIVGHVDLKEPHKCEKWCWMTWGEVCGLDREKLFKPLQSLLAVDFNLLKSYFYTSSLKSTSFKLVTFDLDGTLLRDTTTTLYFSELLGVKDQVLELEANFHSKKIDSFDFMQRISTIMSGLSVGFIEQHVNGLPFIKDIAHTIENLKKFGITTMIVTTANQLFAEAIKKKFCFDYAFGTLFEVKPDGMLGNGIAVCSADHKIQHVSRIAQKIAVSMQQVLAVGDSLTDVPLFSKVGRSIALNSDEYLEGKADRYVKSNTLLEVLLQFSDA